MCLGPSKVFGPIPCNTNTQSMHLNYGFGSRSEAGAKTVYKRAWTALRQELETDFRSLFAPELHEQGVADPYVVGLDECRAAGVGIWGELGGMTSPGLSELIRPAVGERWRGPAPSIVLNEKWVFASPKHTVQRAMAGSFFCHETAHVAEELETGQLVRPEPIEALAAVVVSSPRTWPEHVGAIWQGHGPKWIRIAIHIAYRMRRKSWTIPANLLLRWDKYGYRADGNAFEMALDGEPEERRGESLAAIARSPPPNRFSDFWKTSIDDQG